MIILEGIDLSGKTTLAKILSERYDLPIRKFSKPDKDPVPEYVSEIDKATFPKIYDRFFHGEPIYSKVKGRDTNLGYFELNMLELMVCSRPHLVIYCRPSWKEISDRYTSRGDDYVNLVELSELSDLYDEYMNTSICNQICYDGTNLDRVFQACDTVLDSRDWGHFCAWNRTGMPGIGEIDKPRYLFVGERYNYNAEHQITFWSSSGEYLLGCIREAGINIRDCHFTNAISEDTKPINLRHITLLSPGHVIALGKVAWSHIKPIRDLLLDVDIETREIHHPAYWSRFRSGDHAEYVEGIKLSCGL